MSARRCADFRKINCGAQTKMGVMPFKEQKFDGACFGVFPSTTRNKEIKMLCDQS
jgi:hypothetical protein